jgi:hypothetical protein
MPRHGLALALLQVGIAWALAVACVAEAREYDPASTPKAKYVAPLGTWPAPSYRAKDFTIVEWGGQFHLFYTRVQRHVPFHVGSGANQVLNETSFGHAVSSDLETWTELDTVLSVRPGAWDQHHVWAPSAVTDGSAVYLFYGGVTDSLTAAGNWIPRFQRIGAAMAADANLQVWFRTGGPVWQPCAGGGLPGVSWATCMPYWMVGTADFRDPYVLEPDSKVPGSPYHLFYTARVRTDQFNYVAGVAQAANALGAWSDLGALWDTHYPPQNSKVESPHVLRHDEQLHLFFSGDDATNGIVWMTSFESPLGPWTNRGSLRSMFPPSTLDAPYPFPLEVEAWFASEHFRRIAPTGPKDYFCSAHAYDSPPVYNPPGGPVEDITVIEFREMVWRPDGTFFFATPNPVRSLAWTAPAARPGATVKLRLTSEGVAGRKADLAVSVTHDGVDVPLFPGSVGLPSSVALNEGITEVPWVVPTFGTWLPLDLKVRVASQPLAAAATMHVLSWGESNMGNPDLPDTPPITRTVTLSDASDAAAGVLAGDAHALELRRLPSASASGPGHAFAVELPGAGRARLEMFDVRGRRLRVVLDEDHSAGSTIARWDGRDELGRTAPRGIYFARLSTPFGERTLRLLHLGR